MAIMLTIPIRFSPYSVREYSTWGGISKKSIRRMMPSASSSRSCLARMASEQSGRFFLMELKRFCPEDYCLRGGQRANPEKGDIGTVSHIFRFLSDSFASLASGIICWLGLILIKKIVLVKTKIHANM